MSERIAAVQMVSTADVYDNLKQAEGLITQACAQGAKFVVLPENFAFMGLHEKDILQIAESAQGGEIQKFIAQVAAKQEVELLAGTLPLWVDDTRRDKVHSASLLFNTSGQVVARYHKIHLFDVEVADQQGVYHESAMVTAGTELSTAETRVGVVGLSVCYDLRFPELYRQLGAKGSDLLCVPSAFTYVTGEAHWEILLRARAIENLCYVIAANQGGQHQNKRQTYGHSLIIDPWGKILAEKTSEGPGFICADIDKEALQELRKKFPVLTHRRL